MNSHGDTFAWDYANRLTSSPSVGYSYDYLGRRRSAGLNGVTTRYITAGAHTVGERNTSTGVSTDYLFGPGIDEPLAKHTANGAISYYGVDGLGSIILTTDSSGIMTNSNRYTAWGIPATISELFGYTGRENGGPSWFYRARYYDATTGRFLSEDPLESPSSTSMVGMSANIRAYAYVENDPISRRDPFGLKSCGPLPTCGGGVPCGQCCAQRFQWGLCALEVNFQYAHVYEVGATAAGVAAGAYFSGWQGAIGGGAIGLGASYWYLHELEIAAEAAVQRTFEHCVAGCKNPEACKFPPRPPVPVPPSPPVFGN